MGDLHADDTTIAELIARLSSSPRQTDRELAAALERLERRRAARVEDTDDRPTG